MELFRSLRLRAGTKSLKKRAYKVKRKSCFLNLNLVTTIGIVWDITSQEDLSPISDFILKMNERGIKVEVIAVYQGNLLPDKLTALRYITCLKKEDLSYLYLPKSIETEKFIKTQFDILIEITSRDFLPVKYISVLTPARCKISKSTDEDYERGYADILISIGKNVDTREYLKQVVIYLELINRN